MTTTAWLAAAGTLLFLVAGAVFFIIGSRIGRRNELRRQQQAQATAEETAKRIITEAEREAESLRKAAVLSGKEELIKVREEWEAEIRGRREEVEREERRVDDREGQLNRKYDLLEQRERETNRRTEVVAGHERTVAQRQQELEKLLADERRRLEQIAGISAGDAKNELIHRMEEEAQADAANKIREIRETAKRNADREAKKIIALAIQRIAAEQSVEATVSAVSL
ncbi:MAG TPA: Rnase Y domain-containing protein, partial [Gemmatimonadaceae bacterium]|nr:Rnase Y domain-containing protein [Gemmatimonadaceae bacterium]